VRPRRTILGCLALILAHAVFLVLSALNNSVTYDEFAHLPAGCAYWRWQEFSIYNQSPPLLRLLGSWPAMLAGADAPDAAKFRKFPPKDRHWLYAAAFERRNAHVESATGVPAVDDSGRLQRLFVLGRLGILPISCLGAWLVFAWARRLYGDVPALAACAMWAFNPDVIAHGSIVGTDVGSAVAMLLALFLWQRFLEQPRPPRALAAALAIAAAHLCKFTAVVLWPAILAMLVLAIWRARQDNGREAEQQHLTRHLWTGFAIALLVTWFSLNLAYGHDRSFEPLRNFDFTSRAFLKVRDATPWLPAPLPRQAMLGLDAQKWESDTPRPAFLVGEQYVGGRWLYYPVALAVKLPLGLLALIVSALASLLIRKPNASELPLILAFVVITSGLVAGTQLNVGVRYLLPEYPLAFILIARVWRGEMPHVVRRMASLMLVVLAIESLHVCPRYLTFFNAAAGGPGGGWRVVNDSNADWGQSLLDLRRWMRDRGERRITLAYFGKADPGAYGMEYSLLDDASPIETPYVAVSDYFLAGLPQRMPVPGGDYTAVTRLSFYRELQSQRPVAVVGNALHVFTREQVDIARRAHRARSSE
jgi:hypothetical protein